MRVVKPKTVKEYGRNFPDAAASLMGWLKAVREAQWRSIDDVRESYSHADAVKVASGHVVTVFNIRGNRYRLIVAIHYKWGMLYVLRFLTHAEYDKAAWKQQL
jgi:mRNA interferase HigB